MDADVDDEIVLTNFPVLAVPTSGDLPDADRQGTRYLVAREGLYWELNTAWLRAVQPAIPYVSAISDVGARATPYGSVRAAVQLRCNPPAKQLWSDFLKEARAAFPRECAALLAWNSDTHQWRLAMRGATHASADRIDYVEPVLEPEEIGVIDVHSHGAHPAFFSGLDDIDDWGAIKIAVVFGHVDRERPEVAARIALIDRLLPMRMTEEGWFELKEEHS